MSTTLVPTLAEFLEAALEEVAKVAPPTVIYAAGGTRRRAVFENIEPWSNHFVEWARERILSRINLLFQHGVRNVIVNVFTPDNFREVNRYRSQLLERAKWVVASDKSLADYVTADCRVRLLGTENVPELAETANDLIKSTITKSSRTLYWTVAPTVDSFWEELLVAAQRAKVTTRAEVVRALYGEDIPPATLFLAFGKPTISLDLIPPLLIGQLQCYWSQQPGYTLTEAQLRTVLYDYAYLRPTWQAEKLERAKASLADRKAWEEGPILGLGMRLGPFWYPAPMSSSAWPTE